MDEIKPSLLIANKIIGRTALIGSAIALVNLVLGTGIVSLILYYKGEAVSLRSLYEFYLSNRQVITWLMIMIHVYPVKLYALSKALQTNYRGFRVIIYEIPQPEPSHGIDKVAT